MHYLAYMLNHNTTSLSWHILCCGATCVYILQPQSCWRGVGKQEARLVFMYLFHSSFYSSQVWPSGLPLAVYVHVEWTRAHFLMPHDFILGGLYEVFLFPRCLIEVICDMTGRTRTTGKWRTPRAKGNEKEIQWYLNLQVTWSFLKYKPQLVFFWVFF